MVLKSSYLRALFTAVLLLAAPFSAANELRDTFFKEADAAKAAAEASNAELLSPRNFERGMKEYTDAELALERGRNIETVRSNAADAVVHFTAATRAAELASTALAQVMKSRQDAANAGAPKQVDAVEIWNRAQREFGDAIRLLERGDLKNAKKRDSEATS
ncbi:MAG: hypothetical protein WBN61_14400, partial [Woeseiaceae bacterium]